MPFGLIKEQADKTFLNKKFLRGDDHYDNRKQKNAGKLPFTITGRLDTSTAPKLETTLKGSYDGVTELVFDLANLEYISSAGLRVLLSVQKTMNMQGSMKVINVGEEIMEILRSQALQIYDILTIE